MTEREGFADRRSAPDAPRMRVVLAAAAGADVSALGPWLASQGGTAKAARTRGEPDD